MSSPPSPRISLRRLQLGEKIVINSGGIIWRKKEHPDRTTMMDPARRLEGASALAIKYLDDVHYLSRLLGEVLQATGQPFALRFADVLDEKGERMPEPWDIFRALLAHSDFWDRPERGDDEIEPEIPETLWDQSSYYEAHFEIISAPAQ